ncbi:MAG: 50S ribosomal protein L25 [Candidatus Omnitrophica bacterium]|nr:50S ribosomal protein L25 [Candidatus Omnitrophota bacterium]
MEKIILKASVREERGKNACKQLRKSGFIPAVVYKGGGESLALSLGDRELWRAMHTEAGENAIITLDITGGKKKLDKTVILRGTQLDPIRDKLLHVDFHEISLTEKIKVKVPVSIKGEAAGVKEEGGILNQVLWEVEVECMALKIPEHVEVNVEGLRIGDAIHVKEIEVPAEVNILDDPEQMIVAVNPPHVEEEEAEEVPVEEGEEPELIKKGRKEEEGAAEEEAAPAGE